MESEEQQEGPQEESQVGNLNESQNEPVPPLGWVLLIVLVGSLGWLGYRAYPASHPTKHDPGFIDNVFANNLVLFAARLVLFSTAFVLAFLAVWVVFSAVKGMIAGHVLTKFGPLEMQAVEDMSADVEMWQNLWSEENDENQELRARLEETDTLFGQLYEAYQEVTGGKNGEENSHG
jgi:hypothetical protein